MYTRYFVQDPKRQVEDSAFCSSVMVVNCRRANKKRFHWAHAPLVTADHVYVSKRSTKKTGGPLSILTSLKFLQAAAGPLEPSVGGQFIELEGTEELECKRRQETEVINHY
jgi:hypothetical protein